MKPRILRVSDINTSLLAAQARSAAKSKFIHHSYDPLSLCMMANVMNDLQGSITGTENAAFLIGDAVLAKLNLLRPGRRVRKNPRHRPSYVQKLTELSEKLMRQWHETDVALRKANARLSAARKAIGGRNPQREMEVPFVELSGAPNTLSAKQLKEVKRAFSHTAKLVKGARKRYPRKAR